MSDQPRIFVDQTHCGRHVTGLERITLELFSSEALAPLPVVPLRSQGRKGMMIQQTFGLPARALRDRTALFLCPGFPPSIPLTLLGGDRVIPYVHDLFLLTRPQDLNARAKLYMVAPFRFMVSRAKLLLVNSQTTAEELRRFCRRDAEIVLYRPRVRNVFGVSPDDRASRPVAPGSLKLIAVGTVEPRKNLFAAAAILTALRRTTHPAATLDIVGRPGWGVDMETLARTPGLTVHGYQAANRVRDLISSADALLSTSHDEGLGLPLLEAQYAGLPVIAPKGAVFDEVLGASGILVDANDSQSAASAIADVFSGSSWRPSFVTASTTNIGRWNIEADRDKSHVVNLIDMKLTKIKAKDKRINAG